MEELETNSRDVKKLWDAYNSTYLTPEEAGLAKQLGQGIDKIEKDGIGLIKASLRSHDIAAAKRQVMETAEPMFEMIRARLTSIVDLQISVAREEYDHAVNRYTTLRWATIASIVAGVGMAGVLALLLVRNISSALSQAIDAFERIANRDLTREIHAKGNNEISSLMTAISQMQTALRRSVPHVRQGSKSVATASAQIAQGNQDLSSRPPTPRASAVSAVSANGRLRRNRFKGRSEMEGRWWHERRWIRQRHVDWRPPAATVGIPPSVCSWGGI